MAEFTFEDIKDVLIEEKSTRGLVDLPGEFYSNVGRYVAELSREADRGEAIRRDILKEELRHVLQMVQEIHTLRVTKTLNELAKGVLPASLLDKERNTFNEIRQTLEKLRVELVVSAMAGEAAVVAPKEITNVALIFSADVPQIVAEDMKSYGPFKVGEVGFLPGPRAEFLVKHGLARKIEVKSL
jgi:DNA replication initiation complex subunit (GINS family)